MPSCTHVFRLCHTWRANCTKKAKSSSLPFCRIFSTVFIRLSPSVWHFGIFSYNFPIYQLLQDNPTMHEGLFLAPFHRSGNKAPSPLFSSIDCPWLAKCFDKPSKRNFLLRWGRAISKESSINSNLFSHVNLPVYLLFPSPLLSDKCFSWKKILVLVQCHIWTSGWSIWLMRIDNIAAISSPKKFCSSLFRSHPVCSLSNSSLTLLSMVKSFGREWIL
jgi:hypothetical protein